MQPRRSILRAPLVLALCLVFAGACGNGQGTTPAQPTTAPASTAPAPPATSEARVDVVTAGPTATPVATPAAPAEPFPLAAGWWDNAVCYEVFVRSFYDSDGDGIGDIPGLIEKLDYINDGNPETQGDLGATCVWLMPIAEAASYHGYDTVDYYSVEQDYGTNDDFKQLVEEAHRRGIRVVIDLVLNHTSSEHPWFQEALSNPASPYRDFFIWSDTGPGYRGPWGDVAWHSTPAGNEFYYGVFWSGMPDLNYRNPAVTEESRKISLFWLEEMGVDGFRLDAIKHVIEEGTLQENTAATHAWLRDYRAFLEQSAPDAFTVGEIFGATPTLLAPYFPDQLDSYFVFDIGERIIAAANSGRANQYISAVSRSYSELPFQRWAPFLTNHDQNRVMALLFNDPGKAKIAATALLTLPGMPFVYYGEEIGMQGAKPDERLRTPMQWSDAPGGGFTTGQPWEPFQPEYGQAHVAAQDADPDSLLNLYRRLIHLHVAHPALSNGSFAPLESSDRGVGAFVRQSDEETVLVVLNFDNAPVSGATLSTAASELPPGEYTLAPLLGEEPGASLSVGAGGSIEAFAPLPTLEPQTGYVFQLSQ